MAQSNDDWNVVKMLTWATEYFEEKSIDSPRLSIEWLLSHVLDIRRLDLYMQYDRPLTRNELQTLKPLIKRRAAHEPLQYITGFTDFYNATISVTPDVLIPRPETEELMEKILQDFGDAGNISVLDLGTGSGCIPIALKKAKPDWDLHAIELSEAALDVARKNAVDNNTEIHFFQGDFTKNWPGDLPEMDIVISNPPYIPETEKPQLSRQVISFEPGLALFILNLADVYPPIIKNAETKLKKNGYLYLEIHEDYPETIAGYFDPKIWQVKLLKDYSRKHRFIQAILIG